MKNPIQKLFLALLLWSASLAAYAQSTAFTYNGRLNTNGGAVNGNYEFSFSVYSVAVNGVTLAGPLTVTPVPVTNGLFTATVDFGPGIFTGPSRFLAISVRPVGGGSFQLLSPRQEFTSSPYAIHAATAGTAGSVSNGVVVKSLNNLRDNLTLAAGANMTITPNGNTLTLAAAGVGGSGIWSVNGNNAYYNAGNVGLGTSTPAHRLSLSSGGPSWTANGWLGAVELPDIAAIGWRANAAGQRFGMGHTATGFFMFRTASDPGTIGSPAIYDFTINDTGNVGIGTTAPTGRLQVAGGWDGEQGALQLSGHRPTIRFTGDADTANQSWLLHLGGPAGNLGFFRRTGPAAWSQVMALTSGSRQMEIYGQDALGLIGFQPFLTLFDSNAGYARGRIASVGGDLNLFTENYLNGSNPFAFIRLANNGNVGIGSGTPIAKLEVVGQDALRLIGYQPFLTLLDSSAGYAGSRIQSASGDLILGPQSYITGSDPNAYAKLFNSGNFSVKTLTIRGGADLAEPFELSQLNIAKGSVVVIDDEHAGKLKLSTRAYDTQVAGIVSGANGINPGIALHQEGALEGGQNVALSGRVYVQADAVYGAIKPGDLLTTSGTPGHAMKVTDHARAQGAILGKAMTPLADGKGMVLVLVTLQ